jgi:hypothetical protein
MEMIGKGHVLLPCTLIMDCQMWFVQGRSSVHVINEQKLLAREFDKTALNVSPYLHNSENSACTVVLLHTCGTIAS